MTREEAEAGGDERIHAAAGTVFSGELSRERRKERERMRTARLGFTIERLVVNEEAQQVAARLGFTGVPIREFRGIAATGNAVRFREHAFYQLERGQIRQVWSLLDLAAYRASMAS